MISSNSIPVSPFNAFCTPRVLAAGEPYNLASAPKQEVEDTLFEDKRRLTAKKAVSLFSAGVAGAFAAKWVFGGLLHSKTLGKTLSQPFQVTEQHIYTTFNDPLTSLYRIATEHPAQRRTLLAYLGATVLGYLSGSAVQGTKEAWVRREETKIRAHLLSNLQHAFRKSIRIKTQADNQLRKRVAARLFELLKRHNIPKPIEFLKTSPLLESPTVQQKYFYEPTHRTVQFGVAPLQNAEASELQPGMLFSSREAIIVGAGALAGFAIQGLYKLFTETLKSQAKEGTRIIDTINAPGRESMWLMGMHSPKNLAVLTGFLALAAGARTGQLLVDGLREIEVTGANAETEYRFQKHNWLTLDTGFHNIAEEEALENELRLLEQDMPFLQTDRKALQKRINAIVLNVGRNSAPKYFPMVPAVGLVEARS